MLNERKAYFFCFNKEENNGDNSANYKMKVGGEEGGGKAPQNGV